MKSFILMILFPIAALAEVKTDYQYLYPKSTPEEYNKALLAMKMGCNEARAKQIRIDQKNKGPKEKPEETCECLARNIAPAKDIHEVRVLNAMFRGQTPPASVFADVEELSDVFDERPDYRQHAYQTIEACKTNKDVTYP
jgi:hypothetical protein